MMFLHCLAYLNQDGAVRCRRNTRRLNTAPGDNPGRHATLRITAMRPRHRPTASRHPTEAAVSGGNSTRNSR